MTSTPGSSSAGTLHREYLEAKHGPALAGDLEFLEAEGLLLDDEEFRRRQEAGEPLDVASLVGRATPPPGQATPPLEGSETPEASGSSTRPATTPSSPRPGEPPSPPTPSGRRERPRP